MARTEAAELLRNGLLIYTLLLLLILLVKISHWEKPDSRGGKIDSIFQWYRGKEFLVIFISAVCSQIKIYL